MLKILSISFLIVCIASISCNNKKPATDKTTAITAEEFEFMDLSQQLDSFHKEHPDSFFVFMERLKTNMQNYLDTAGLWDCGEFSSSTYRIQIPHPPKPKKPDNNN